MYKNKLLRFTPKGHRVFLITCAETGKDFEHTQIGRGRPPVLSPEGRAIREARLANETRNVKAFKTLKAEDRAPQVGNYAMRLTTGMKRSNAMRWLTPVPVTEVKGEVSTVIHEGKPTEVRTSSLIPVS